MQRQRAVDGPSVSDRGQKFRFNKVGVYNSAEYKLTAAVPQLAHLQQAIADLESTRSNTTSPVKPPAYVIIKRTLGIPRPQGGADIVYSHPSVFHRQSKRTALDDIAFSGCDFTDALGVDVADVWYGQVGTPALSNSTGAGESALSDVCRRGT